MKSLRSQLTGLSALLILLIAIKPVHGQELRATEDSALLEVHVTNFDNEPHKGITVIFEGQKTGATYKGVSDENGRFSILLPEGDTYDTKYKAFDKTFSYQNIELPSKRGRMSSQLRIKIEPPTTFTLEDVHFESGKATLRKSSYDRLNEMVEYMKSKPSVKLEIAGHTDNVGSKQDNKKLSLQRAKAVKNYLVEQGIEEKRLVAKGYGESQPVATNETKEGRQKNRRTEVRILER